MISDLQAISYGVKAEQHHLGRYFCHSFSNNPLHAILLEHPTPLSLFIHLILPLHQASACSMSADTFHATPSMASLSLLCHAPTYLDPIYLAIHPSLLGGNLYPVCSFSYISVLRAATRLETPLGPVLFLLEP